MKYLLTTLLLVISVSHCYSQSPEDKLGSWYMLDANHRISDKFGIKTGGEFRTYEVFDNINLLFYYAGVNYHLNTKASFSLVYGYLDIDKSYATSGQSHLYENRIYEQFSYNHKTSFLPLNHRLRLEHRFMHFHHNHTTQHRLRYRLGTKIKLDNLFFINIRNEVFANLEGEVFTENRFYTALGLNVSKSSNIQLGYLNHEISKSNLHRLQVGLFIKTDFRKEK
ncbi:DUF2490 domain-containing protein [Mariniflexile ostreae]|uniref:DUF2490 domain-containing protein n=1 Tax=Mariniflexile ostreae TaxID=1520892 RepID=A0ABV5F861_9FLAO